MIFGKKAWNEEREALTFGEAASSQDKNTFGLRLHSRLHRQSETTVSQAIAMGPGLCSFRMYNEQSHLCTDTHSDEFKSS